MKTCPNCSAANWDDAAVCYNCGREIPPTPGAQSWNLPPVEGASPTQPVKIYPPSSNYIPPQETPPSQTQPVYPAYPQQGYPQGVNQASSYQPGPYPPGANQAGPFTPNYPPPPEYAPVREQNEPNRPWALVILGLAVVLLVGCGILFYAVTRSTASAASDFGSNLSTQVAGGFGGVSAQPTATPEEPFEPPTPWPTFTPEDTAVPPTTEPFDTEKLLSPQCSEALDRLKDASQQVSDNPASAFDEAWRAKLDEAVAGMKDSCGSLDQASPLPGALAEAQTKLDSAGSEFDQSRKLFDEGVKELNLGKILDAGDHLRKATEELNAAIDQIRKLGE